MDKHSLNTKKIQEAVDEIAQPVGKINLDVNYKKEENNERNIKNKPKSQKKTKHENLL